MKELGHYTGKGMSDYVLQSPQFMENFNPGTVRNSA